jgi:hypothetical protein
VREETSHGKGPAAAPAMFACACAIFAGVAGSAALAGAEPLAPHQKSIDRVVAFLEEHQLESGAYADSGTEPSQSISAWVTLALAAAGIKPLDQTRFVDGAPCGHSAEEYLEAHFAAGVLEEIAKPEIATTALERELLVVDTSGTDPHDFAGHDLVAELIGRQLPDGSLPYVPGGEGQINDVVFGILALAPVKEPEAEAAVSRAAGWLQGEADADGGFNWRAKGLASEADLTGAAIEALVAAGDKGTPAEADALAFLHAAQLPDGGFPELRSEGESNVASTAWGAQGIWASGGDPETWVVGEATPPAEPLDYMESMQQADGHIRWRASSDMNGIWMTAYVLPAFTGQVLPYPLVPRAEPSAARLPSCEPVATGTPEGVSGSGGGGAGGGGAAQQRVDGPGGSSEAPVAGVGAGGGGQGARDFSRPLPGSKGKTPGGARIVHPKQATKARDHSRSRRGANQHQASGTETAEPQAPSESDQEVAAVSGAATASGKSGAGGDGGGGHDKVSGRHGAPAPAKDVRRQTPRTPSGREVSGAVIGSAADDRDKVAFGAPGLRSAGRSGGGEEPWVPLAIGAGALALLALGARRELRARPLGGHA